MKHAFSLVELSIVLVILGLLVGGVLSGQSLIRAAELRAVTSEYQRYYTAAQTFRDKYFAIPGDFNNAQAFWGQSTLCGGASATGVCNGNGNGTIEPGAAINATGEIFQFWRQLALAGLIEGTYTGAAGPTAPTAGWDTIPGTNAPKSRVGIAGWGTRNLASYGGDTCTPAADYGNLLSFGGIAPGYIPTNQNVLKPEEAWNIDTKIDDGKPDSGRVIAACWGVCTNGASTSDTTASYALSTSSLSCMIYFTKVY